MWRWMFLLGLTAVFGLAGGAGLAGDDPKDKKAVGKNLDPKAMFEKVDADGDGKLTKDEFKKAGDKIGVGEKGGALIDRLFDRLDANSDGELTVDEFKKFGETREKIRDKIKAKIDPDKVKQIREKIKGGG